ncbi:MAG: acetyl-CoA C-acetyltransferase, partial [Pseudomonadota bacterium]
KELIQRNNIDPSIISEVILGQVLTTAQGQNPARQASIHADIPKETPACLINQVCGSGLRSVAIAAQSILTGDSDVVIAGGQENMSLSPHAIHLREAHKFGDTKLTDVMMTDGLIDAFAKYHMGVTAENLAKKYNITRVEQDEFACLSQNKAEEAQKNNCFKDEITPITLRKKSDETFFYKDEFIRLGTSVESLSKLRPAFDKDGTVTAGNSSGINDGAAIILLMEKRTAEKHGLKPMAKIVSYANAGVDPSIMGIGPVYATRKALMKANWDIKDLDLIEANEAFAAQAISVNREMNWDLSKVNVNGGAIAIGHPIGASGARILVTLLYEMQKRDSRRGLATLCIGGGMGIAMCIERI